MNHNQAMKEASQYAREHYHVRREELMNKGYGRKLATKMAEQDGREVLVDMYTELMSQEYAA